MKAGFAEIVITPPDRRCLLAGYGLPWSTGVHDDLCASAVYFQDGETRALLISFDLLAMERDFIARLKAAIQAALPIPAGNIFFTCTHTHEGPEVRERKFRDHWGPHDRPDYLDGYQRFLMDRVAEVAAAAAAGAQEFDLVVNRAHVDENVNRRFFLTDETYLSIPGNKHLLDVAREHADKELGILAFCPPGSRRPFGLILNYTMHPLTAGNTSTLISADVPGVVRADRQGEHGLPGLLHHGRGRRQPSQGVRGRLRRDAAGGRGAGHRGHPAQRRRPSRRRPGPPEVPDALDPVAATARGRNSSASR